MRTTALMISATASIALVCLVRCSEPVHQCGLDITCGQGDRLVGEQPPGSTTQSGGDTNNGADSGVAPTSSAVCTPLADPDGGNCSVSFNNDILQKMLGAAGSLGCAKDQCHTATSGLLPIIDTANPLATYKALYSVNTGTSHNYINPCSTDPTMSDIVGNLTYPAASGTGSHMPQDNNAIPNATDLGTITTWVKCGAPFN